MEVPAGVFSTSKLPHLTTLNLTAASPAVCPAGSVRLRTSAQLGAQPYCAASGDCVTNAQGAVNCSCIPGSFQPPEPSEPCDLCSPGTTQPLHGQSRCEACAQGTYTRVEGSDVNASQCTPCGDAAHFCPEGSATPRLVQPGWYSTPVTANVTRRSGEKPCSVGSFCVYVCSAAECVPRAVPCCHWTHSLLTSSSWYGYTPAAMAWKRRVRPASSLPRRLPRAASRAHPVPTPAVGPQSVMLTSAALSLSLAAAALSYYSVSPSAASCGLGGDIVGS